VKNRGVWIIQAAEKQWAQKTNLKQNVKDAVHIPDIL
jgi:hypothetical protein